MDDEMEKNVVLFYKQIQNSKKLNYWYNTIVTAKIWNCFAC